MNITIGQVTFSAVLDRELVLLRVADLVAASGEHRRRAISPGAGAALQAPGPLPRPRHQSGATPRSRSPSRSLPPNPATSDPSTVAASVGIAASNAAPERVPSLRHLAPGRCPPRACSAMLAAISDGASFFFDCPPAPQWTLASVSFALHLRLAR